MNEILAAMDVIKCYAWEQSFQSKVQDIRNDELSWFRRAQLLAATSYWLKRDYFYPIHLSILSFQQVLLRMDIFHGNNSKENLSSDSDADKSRTPIDKNNAQDIIMEKVLKKRTFRVPLKLVEKTAGAGSILSKESYSEAKTRLSELKDIPTACENARLYLVELQKIVKNLESNKPWLPREGSHTEKVSRVNRIPKPKPKIEKKPPKEEESASSESASKEVESTETSSEPDGP
ncbi:hypothetical protein GUJ93_ZPchr0001g29633 [Zizania palustris]|uniref:Uncharacterized protein n=1 Tax=Zizania palustris TaxID=103762 RepID=A0A8J5RP67_ZIZPA|nr:hypothetical protein GUJ93_ZPchr0001g29633 [Zizania palustris]